MSTMATSLLLGARHLGAALSCVLLIACVYAPSALGQNANPSDANGQFYPEDVEANSQFCAIPLWQNESEAFQPADGLCENVTEDILFDNETIQALAEAYAPYLYFHPRERYTMSSVNRTFGDPTEGRIYQELNGRELFDENLNQSSLLKTTRDYNYVMHSHLFYFEHDLYLDNRYKKGDGFTEEGLSRAPIYYRAFDSGNGTITFNYFMYYAWNGPASIGILTSLKRIGQYIRFSLPPFGVHEGDWESMSVTVCKSEIPSQPLATYYRQHGHGQVLNCGNGECNFHRNSTTHPVAFISLNSHVVYPFTANEIVYHQAWLAEFILNLQGILIVDRTAYADSNGNYRYYEPNSDNVIRIPEQRWIPDNVTDDNYWAAYGGAWGSTQDSGHEVEGDEPLCVTDGNCTYYTNGTSFCAGSGDLIDTDCPPHEDNPVFWYVMQMLGVEDAVDSIIASARDVKTAFRRIFSDTFMGPTGPATRGFYDELQFPGNTPLFDIPTVEQNDTSDSYCQRLLEPANEDLFSTDIDILPLTKNVIGILCMCVFFTLFNIIYFLRKRNEDVRPVLLTDESGRYLAPNRQTRKWVYMHAWIYTVAYIVTFAGALLFFSGYSSLTDLLEDTFSGIDFQAIEAIFLALGIFILIIDTMLFIILWLRTEDLWRQINITYYGIVGNNDEEGKRFDMFDRRCGYSTEAVDVVFLVSFALLLVSLILAVVMVIVAIFNVGFAYGFGQICDEVIGALDGICLRFDALGLDEIRCGGDFQKFCNNWAQTDVSFTLWGAFVVIIGHFYLIAAGGMAALSNRSVKRALLLYPSNEEYTAMLAKIEGLESKMGDQPPESVKKESETEDHVHDDLSREHSHRSYWSRMFGSHSAASHFHDEKMDHHG